MQDVLFYTTNCSHSSKLLTFMKKNYLFEHKDIQYVSLDNLRMINQCLTAVSPDNKTYVIPMCINSVPSIISRSNVNSQVTLSGTNSVISYLKEKYKMNNDNDNEPDGLSNSYSNTAAFDAGFTSEIQIDPIRKDTNNEIDIEKLKRDRNADVQMNQRNI